jgi:hypothetical protein
MRAKPAPAAGLRHRRYFHFLVANTSVYDAGVSQARRGTLETQDIPFDCFDSDIVKIASAQRTAALRAAAISENSLFFFQKQTQLAVRMYR